MLLLTFALLILLVTQLLRLRAFKVVCRSKCVREHLSPLPPSLPQPFTPSLAARTCFSEWCRTEVTSPLARSRSTRSSSNFRLASSSFRRSTESLDLASLCACFSYVRGYTL
jgi:hypothetical protein